MKLSEKLKTKNLVLKQKSKSLEFESALILVGLRKVKLCIQFFIHCSLNTMDKNIIKKIILSKFLNKAKCSDTF